MTARSRIAYPLLGFLILTLGTPQPGAASHINKKFAHAAFWRFCRTDGERCVLATPP